MTFCLNHFFENLISFFCWLYIHLVAITSTIKVVGSQKDTDFLKQKKPFIYAFWHNRQFFLTYLRKNIPVHVLVSQSKDGEYITRTMKYFGLKTVRGSSSKGGVSALIQLIRLLRSGHILGITPDGPRGPAREVQPGIIHLAQKTGYPIIPISYDARRKKVFKSWDEFIVPYPFNQIVYSVGEPILINKEENITASAVRIKNAINEVSNMGTLVLYEK
ncbi:MAG: lysophospholipid acyltransferase family protein [Candidatus Aureabacteria bacterium]|nr:lysophospholipid acyltransferase family protein [Candidatus Auribacterota bacterium]